MKLTRSEIALIVACLDDGSYTQQERHDFTQLAMMALSTLPKLKGIYRDESGRWQCLDCLNNGSREDEEDEGIKHYVTCPALTRSPLSALPQDNVEPDLSGKGASTFELGKALGLSDQDATRIHADLERIAGGKPLHVAPGSVTEEMLKECRDFLQRFYSVEPQTAEPLIRRIDDHLAMRPLEQPQWVSVPRAELEAAHERWNRQYNERAMMDALSHYDECAERWLAAPVRAGEEGK